MSSNKECVSKFIKIVFHNALKFIYMLIFINIFQFLFGPEQVLTTVAMAVGFFMLPAAYTGVKRSTTGFMVLGLYISSGIVAQLALVSPWIALPINFIYIVIIFLLTCEPALLQPSISFILCFVFSQATPVPVEVFPMRLLCTAAGGTAVAVATIISWKCNGYGKNGRTLKEQVKKSMKNDKYILRMAAGISIAMFIGMVLELKKPLWISIVVMSLTQIDYKDTLLRIKYRSISTVIGGTLFLIFFGFFVPKKYHILIIMSLSYLVNFTSQYRYKQIINAICALNASMVLLTTPMALINRVLCLISGIAIVIIMWKIQSPLSSLYYKLRQFHMNAENGKERIEA